MNTWISNEPDRSGTWRDLNNIFVTYFAAFSINATDDHPPSERNAAERHRSKNGTFDTSTTIYWPSDTRSGVSTRRTASPACNRRYSPTESHSLQPGRLSNWKFRYILEVCHVNLVRIQRSKVIFACRPLRISISCPKVDFSTLLFASRIF